MVVLTGLEGGEPITEELTTVEKVDLDRYLGLWYELARIPNPFQKKCAKNTTAEYSLRDDGKITVVNTCVKANGDVITARGIARVMDTATGAKLKVSFVKLLWFNLFWGDYWIIGLDADYRWAIVGDPQRKYGWVLSREKALAQDQWEIIKGILDEKRYGFDRFVLTTQE
jgi:apolipoprotein D and lipocalin family protein